MKTSLPYVFLFISLWLSCTFVVFLFTFPDMFRLKVVDNLKKKHESISVHMYPKETLSEMTIHKDSATNVEPHPERQVRTMPDERIVPDQRIESRYELEKAYFTPRTEKVNPLDAEFIIVNQNFCEDVIPYLLVIVPSVHKNAEVRHVIRSVYGSQASSSVNVQGSNTTVKLLFLFGKGNSKLDEEILQESQRYGDIVQIDFLDTYHNLSRKILYGLKWVSTYCSEVEFVLKADEDVFVNIPVLLDYLHKTPYDMKGAVYGFIYRDSVVIRVGRWAVTKDEYPLVRYPHYASGNSYVISGNIISRLFMVSEHMPYLPIEDAFITGCLVKLIGAKLKHNRAFTRWLSKTPAPCDFVRKHRISTTKVTISLFYKFLNAVQSYQTVCK